MSQVQLALPALPQEELLAAAQELKTAPAGQVLAWAERRFGANAAISSSFGAEDVVLIDLARQLPS